MGDEDSLPCSQQPAEYLCPEPDICFRVFPSYRFKIRFNIILSSKLMPLKWLFSLIKSVEEFLSYLTLKQVVHIVTTAMQGIKIK